MSCQVIRCVSILLASNIWMWNRLANFAEETTVRVIKRKLRKHLQTYGICLEKIHCYPRHEIDKNKSHRIQCNLVDMLWAPLNRTLTKHQMATIYYLRLRHNKGLDDAVWTTALTNLFVYVCMYVYIYIQFKWVNDERTQEKTEK
jgi:hypothetical protein